MKYEAVIGLEIHVQLKTDSKMFCDCDNAGEAKPVNTTICPVCTGQPGTLPVINEKAIEYAVRASLALDFEISRHTHFDRKSYFYPDLPKGYQISQYSEPIGKNGHLDIMVVHAHRYHGTVCFKNMVYHVSDALFRRLAATLYLHKSAAGKNRRDKK